MRLPCWAIIWGFPAGPVQLKEFPDIFTFFFDSYLTTFFSPNATQETGCGYFWQRACKWCYPLILMRKDSDVRVPVFKPFPRCSR